MVWFFTRDQEQLQFETMYDNGAGEFVVRLAWSDGRQSSERFSTLDAFNARVLQLERELERERWKNAGPPLVIPEGFPNRRLT